jgi:signal transduction histidine kinase
MGPARRTPARAAATKSWPSEAEQTLEALRAGLIDAVVINEGQRDSVYALKTFEELEEANRRLLESQERLLNVLNEREHLMQDLHDGCIQSIYAVGLALEACRGLIPEDPAAAAHRVAQAEASLNLVIQELRAFISGTHAQTEVDLPREIARIVAGSSAQGPRFEVDVDPDAARALGNERAGQLLQVTREALSNVVRHANAKSVRITLQRRGSRIRLEVADDGDGFDTAAAASGTGLGLHHISARVQKLGGRLQLRSKPSRGCRIVVELAR